MRVLRIIGAVAIGILIGWLALAGVNVGGLLSSILGKKPSATGTVTNSEGEEVGTEAEILPNKNPLRDKSVIKTSGGEIRLPKGVKDTDVKRVTKIGINYKVEVKHEKATAIFDD